MSLGYFNEKAGGTFHSLVEAMSNCKKEQCLQHCSNTKLNAATYFRSHLK